MMGRSASRNIARKICGNQLSTENCHLPFMRTFDEYNSIVDTPKILMLRNPIERAISASTLCYNPVFHGSPFLHKIDFDSVTHIIKFEEIDSYLGENCCPEKIDEDIVKTLDLNGKISYYVAKWNEYDGVGAGDPERAEELKERMLTPWSLDDYDYTEEINLYKKFIDNKPTISPKLFNRFANDYNYIDARNIKIPGKRCRDFSNK